MRSALKQAMLTGTVVVALVATPGLAAAGIVLSYTGSLQTYTVATTGSYQIAAYGAQGASGATNHVGGKGAFVSGIFQLTAGELLQIAVGGMGLGQGSQSNGGGGGGSFLVDPLNNPLLIAGGGGGTRASANQDGIAGQVSQFGTTGSGFNSTGGGVLKATGLGQGGSISFESFGSAGAGFFSNGANDTSGSFTYGTGGRSFANGLAGGQISPNGVGFAASGGYGGGGAGNGGYGGGGGGGYSGGDGGYIGGGGGSYNLGTSQQGISGFEAGNGLVTIDLVVVATPEPSTLISGGIAALIGLGHGWRRRWEKIAA